MVLPKAVERAAGIHVIAHDLARGIDPDSLGECGTRGVDRGERALVQQKTVLREPIIVTAHDLAGSIDSERVGGVVARKIDQGESALVQKEAVVLARGFEVAHDLPGRIDPDGLGEYGAGGSIVVKVPLSSRKPWSVPLIS